MSVPTKRPRVAFVDDTGNTSLDLQAHDVGSHFIVTAVIVAQDEEDKARHYAEEVRAKHFQTGEMKSSGVARKLVRRVRVLRDLAAGPWRYYSLAIDKSQIRPTSGLIYKRPFIKFLHRQLYERLFEAFSTLSIVADEHGSQQFMAGFERYVGRHFSPDLFSEASFVFRDSKTDPLLQVADFIGGSLGYVFDPRKATEHSPGILNVLGGICLGIEEWPPSRRLFALPSAEVGPYDNLVREKALAGAADYVESLSEASEEDRICQREALKYLLFYFMFYDPAQFVAGTKLVEIVRDQTGMTLTRDNLRLRVIGPLRDAGVLITSSPKGYKLPRSVTDMLSFVEHGHSIIAPMLDRLDRARRLLKLASDGGVDILDDARYFYLKACVESRLGAKLHSH